MQASQRLSIEDAARRLRYDFLGRAAADARRRPHCRRPHAGRPGRDVPAEADARRRADRARRHLSAARHRRSAAARRVAARICGRTSQRAARRGSRTRRTTTWTIRATGFATWCCPSWTGRLAARPGPRLPGRPALVREDGQWLDELGRRPVRRRWRRRTPDGLEIDARRWLAPSRRRSGGGSLLDGAAADWPADREVGLEHVEAVLGRLWRAMAAGVDVPGGRVELRRGKLVLIQAGRVGSK